MANDIQSLIKKIEALNHLTVKAGILEGATYPDGTKVSEIAKLQEFGDASKKIPARPFMRETVFRHGKDWAEIFKRGLVNGYLEGKLSIVDMGHLVAGQMEDDIRKTIEEGVDPPSSVKTISKKIKKYGKDRGTLRDSYTLLKSIGSEVDIESF